MRSMLIGLVAAAAMCWCGAVLLQPAAAQTGKRVALVIGNGAYEKVNKLPNPPRDADAMGAMLKAAGFDVVVGRDLGLRAMQKALRELSDKVQDAEIAMVYYAGHGIEVDGVNYLIPVDAALERDLDVKDEAVSLERVTEFVDAARLRVVILDACRDNPFLRSIKRTSPTRSVGRGLARVDAGSDTLIAFAAKHGSTAMDGTGANSPYTAALVKYLPTPGLDLLRAFGRVRDEVLRSTGKQQEPFVYQSLGGDVAALVPAAGAPQAGLQAPPPTLPQSAPVLSAAASEWQRISKTSSVELETFLRRHPDSPEADYARAYLEDLRKTKATASPSVAGVAGIAGGVAERDRIAAELSYKALSRAAVLHLDCDALWYLRNALFARHGFRFKSERGKRAFGTGGTVDTPQLSALESDNIREIEAAEQMKGCR